MLSFRDRIRPISALPVPYILLQVALLWRQKSQESMLTALYKEDKDPASIHKFVSGSLGVKYKEKHSDPKVKI